MRFPEPDETGQDRQLLQGDVPLTATNSHSSTAASFAMISEEAIGGAVGRGLPSASTSNNWRSSGLVQPTENSHAALVAALG